MKTVTGLYDSYNDAGSAVEALEDAGIASNEISIITNKGDGVDIEDQGTDGAEGAGTGAGIGAVAGGAGGLLVGLGILAIPGVGPVVAAGWLAATAAGAVAGAVAGGAVGGIVGAMTREGVPKEEANFYAEGIRRGGSLVAARVEDQRVAQAQSILQATHSVSAAERRASYVEQGWSRFDEGAIPYTPEQIAAERERNRAHRL